MDGELIVSLRRYLPQVHWVRIETGTATGVPDVNYCFQRVEGWIELKKADANVVDVRATQVAWIERRKRAGGRVFIMVRRRRDMWLFDGDSARGLYTRAIKLNQSAPLGTGGQARWPWDRVLATLTGAPPGQICPNL